MFNWLIAGTDAHAKNYSLLLGARGAVRLAPLYDLASMLPYSTLELRRVNLAMKMGGEYLVRNIGLRHWQRVATQLRLRPESLIEDIRAMASALPDHAAAVLAQMKRDGLSHPTADQADPAIAAKSAALRGPRWPLKDWTQGYT